MSDSLRISKALAKYKYVGATSILTLSFIEIDFSLLARAKDSFLLSNRG